MIKKLIVILGLIGFLFASVSSLMAGGIVNKQNLSADYFRSLTRNASTDAADIVAFNPAGVMKLQTGLYTKLDMIYVDKEYKNTVANVYPFQGEDGTYVTDDPSTVPGFFAVLKRDEWAGFFAVTIPGGGGKVTFGDGNARTGQLATSIITNPATGGAYVGIDDMYLEADSIQAGYSLGGAFEISNLFSVAGGVRFVDATQSFAGYADLTLNPLAPAGTPDRFEVDLDRKAQGWSWFLGLNIAPIDRINIGLMYMDRTKLDWETDVIKDDIGVAPALGWDKNQRNDLPGVIGLGVAIRLIDPILFEFNYTRYLETAAALDERRFESPGDSYDMGFSFTYTINSMWRASAGYLVTDIKGTDKEDLRTEAPELDASTLACGLVFSPTSRFDVSLGFTDVDYAPLTTDVGGSSSPANTKYEKDSWAISLGLQYRWL